MATDNHQQAIHLADTIQQTFNASEYKALCFRLGLDAEQFPTAVDLVSYYSRRALLATLLAECERLRPKIQWRLAGASASTYSPAHTPVEPAQSINQAAEYPIFLSYAPLDDQALIPEQLGWVSTFIDKLRFFLNTQAGQVNPYPIWWDTLLSGNAHRDQEIQRRLAAAKVLIAILSPAYLENLRCLGELNYFANRYGSQAGRLFIVEMTAVTRPAVVQDLAGFQFWQRDRIKQQVHTLGLLNAGQDAAYLNEIQALAAQLLKRLRDE